MACRAPGRLKVRSVRRCVFFFPVIAAIACAENRLHTYMIVQNPVARQAKKPPRRGEIELSRKPLYLAMHAPDADDLDNLAEDLKLTSVTKYHRLPPLTLLRFDFENRTALPWRLDLRSAYFADQSGKKYPVLSADEYAKRFTSVSYEHFRYDAMYAAYITARAGTAPKDAFWFDKKKPDDALEVGYEEGGFQIVPFEFIPAGTEELTFYYNVEGSKKRLSIRLQTERGS
ncbi:MAG: hypothetical protein U1F16_06090 [Turneriella sp.]